MKGVLKAMFLAKLKVVVAAVMVASALGAGGVAYHAGRPAAAQADAPAGKAPQDLEALRKENELLRLNLQVVLEKVKAQEAELCALKGRVGAAASTEKEKRLLAQLEAVREQERAATLRAERARYAAAVALAHAELAKAKGPNPVPADPLKQAEAAVKALREARDPAAKRAAADALERAMKRLREQMAPPATLRAK